MRPPHVIDIYCVAPWYHRLNATQPCSHMGAVNGVNWRAVGFDLLGGPGCLGFGLGSFGLGGYPLSPELWVPAPCHALPCPALCLWVNMQAGVFCPTCRSKWREGLGSWVPWERSSSFCGES